MGYFVKGEADPMKELALYTIEAELAELLALREQAVEEGELPEAIAAIDTRIAEYCSAEVAKVDRIAGAIRACERNRDEVHDEASRLYARAKAWDTRMEHIKEAALRAMQSRGIKSLETPENKLTVCGNGGVEPLEYTGEAAIPDRLCTATVTMSLRLWQSLCRDMSEVDCREILKSSTDVDAKAIREALKRGETVPGAKLPPRGEHLRLK